MHVLYVCTGNICRSPMAAAIARDALVRSGRGDVEISSAGTWALEGHAATGDARRTAAAHGLDLSDHRARQLTPELVAAADVVIGMEHEHADEARRLGARRAITLEQQIRDPYGLSLEIYGNTWALLATLVPAALDDLD